MKKYILSVLILALMALTIACSAKPIAVLPTSTPPDIGQIVTPDPALVTETDPSEKIPDQVPGSPKIIGLNDDHDRSEAKIIGFVYAYPHAHILYWDREQGVKDYFTQPEKVNDIRKRLIKDIFHDEFQTLYNDKAQASGAVKDEAADVLDALLEGLDGRRDAKKAQRTFAAISEDYASGHLLDGKISEAYFQRIGAGFLSLADAVPKSGRLHYKLMPPEVKARVDALVREMVQGNPQCRRVMARYLDSVERVASMYSDKPENHKAMRDKAEADLYKDLGNRVLRAVKQFREQERAHEEGRAHTIALLSELFSFLSRKLEQSEAHHSLVRGEMSKQAKIEYALKMESRGLDWER